MLNASEQAHLVRRVMGLLSVELWWPQTALGQRYARFWYALWVVEVWHAGAPSAAGGCFECLVHAFKLRQVRRFAVAVIIRTSEGE